MIAEYEYPLLPAFIKAVPGKAGTTDNPCELFDFWAPERLGIEEPDYWAGGEHFKAAVSYARAIGANQILANAIGAMRYREVGPIELGFIDALASKATYGRRPDPVTETVAELTIQMCCTTIEEIRHGEAEAGVFLDIAREIHCPEVISGLLLDTIRGEMGFGTLTFIWTVCGAAMMGAAH